MKLTKSMMGFLLIIAVIVSNAILAGASMMREITPIMNTYGWGFSNAIVVMLGMMWMGEKEKK